MHPETTRRLAASLSSILLAGAALAVAGCDDGIEDNEVIEDVDRASEDAIDGVEDAADDAGDAIDDTFDDDEIREVPPPGGG